MPARKGKPDYRERMRAAGLRQIRIWVLDTTSPGFAAKCRRQARAIASGDPAGDEIMRFVESMRTWPSLLE